MNIGKMSPVFVSFAKIFPISARAEKSGGRSNKGRTHEDGADNQRVP